MTFTLHRVRVVVPNGSSYTDSVWDYDIDEYVECERICDFHFEAIVFGVDAAWALYRKTIKNFRDGYFCSDYGNALVTIESALVPDGCTITASRNFPYINESSLPELKWELVDETKIRR